MTMKMTSNYNIYRRLKSIYDHEDDINYNIYRRLKSIYDHEDDI